MPEWRNWDGEQHCRPREIARPRTEAEIVELVKRSKAVKAVGAGHSFTDCATTDGTLLDLRHLDRILDVDGTKVTVEGGARLHALGAQLADLGLALENQGDIDTQAITGAIATATHGTGRAFGNLSSRIVGVRLVDGTGELHDITGGDELKAARVAVGALGVVTAVTVDCVPLYTLHRHDVPTPLDETLDQLDSLVDSLDHFEFFIFPYTRTALTRRTRRSTEAPQPTPHWKRRIQEDLVENKVLSLVCKTGKRFPSQVPRLNRVITKAMSESRVTDHAYRVYATRREVRFTEMEYAIPRAHAREAVERILDHIESSRLPILFPLEVRFSAPDDALLSTAHERETAYIAVHQYAGMAYRPLLTAAEGIFDSYGGRPHWGKRHYQTADTLKARYPAWDRFQQIRKRLDPDGVFANSYTRRVLDG